jgi:hypothetical protein
MSRKQPSTKPDATAAGGEKPEPTDAEIAEARRQGRICPLCQLAIGLVQHTAGRLRYYRCPKCWNLPGSTWKATITPAVVHPRVDLSERADA